LVANNAERSSHNQKARQFVNEAFAVAGFCHPMPLALCAISRIISINVERQNFPVVFHVADLARIDP
jgi:hypothetical protein